ncbi:leukocyte elastase inhibitor-like [Rhinoraja longicauda]
MDSLNAANSQFASDLFLKLYEEHKTENIFLSPLSVSVALAMVYLGAKNNTAVEMAKVLHFGTVHDVHAKFKELMDNINKPDAPYTLKLANRIYGEETYNILRKFQSSSLKYYGAELAPVGFIRQPEAARKEINTFVENKTEDKIQKLIPADAITPQTILILVNAIYFKGKWESKFDEKDTYVAPFKLNKKESKSINMMRQEAHFKFEHIEELGASVLELPYEENELSMIILLPDDINDSTTGLEQLEQALENNSLLKWISLENMAKRKVKVHLPRFKLEDQFQLEQILPAMGMRDAFYSSGADFTGMSEKRDLWLSKVIHKSFVEVNEEGTEAAAATAITMVRRAAIQATPTFVADHPFLFFIKHNKTQSILFMGQYTTPADEVVESGDGGKMMQQVQSCTQKY